MFRVDTKIIEFPASFPRVFPFGRCDEQKLLAEMKFNSEEDIKSAINYTHKSTIGTC